MSSAAALLALLGLGAFALFSSAKASEKTASKSLPTSTTTGSRKKTLIKNALKLLAYVNKGGKKAPTIRGLQMRIGAKQTGVADSQSEKRIEQILGYDVDWKPKGKVVRSTLAAKKTTKARRAKRKPIAVKGEADPITAILSRLAPKPAPKKKVVVKQAKPKRRVIRALPASTVTTTKPKPKPKLADSPQVLAAQRLHEYLLSGGLDRNVVKGYQEKMGNLTVDGVPGPLTLARAESLLDKDLVWPHIKAAIDLHKYYKVDRGRNRDVVKGYQEKMGELAIDGLVGPKTKKRYRALTGKKW